MFDGAEKFVEELHRRWMRRRGREDAGHAVLGRATVPAAGARDAGQRRLLSYAREDLPAVQRLKAAARCAGITTWFEHGAGSKVATTTTARFVRIFPAAVFRARDFATTQRRLEALFPPRVEYATDRARNIAEGAVFILPVCIDDTTEAPRTCRRNSRRCTSRGFLAANRHPNSRSVCRSSFTRGAHEH